MGWSGEGRGKFEFLSRNAQFAAPVGVSGCEVS